MDETGARPKLFKVTRKSCYVWSSETIKDGQVMALCLKSNYKGILNAGRDQGLSIRPVCD